MANIIKSNKATYSNLLHDLFQNNNKSFKMKFSLGNCLQRIAQKVSWAWAHPYCWGDQGIVLSHTGLGTNTKRSITFL